MKKIFYLFITLIIFSSCKKDDDTVNLIGTWELANIKVWENDQLSAEYNYPVDGTRFIVNFDASKIYSISYNSNNSYGKLNEDTYVKDGNSITFGNGSALESLGGTLNKNGDTFTLTSTFENFKQVYVFKRTNLVIPANSLL